jgi:class 3 adenylate cyclase/predicted ATPase
MGSLFPTLISYVPRLTVARLLAHPQSALQPTVDRFATAVLFADVSGFTALTERLSQRGRVGSEDLTTILNASFGRLIEIVLAHGGDVVKFAGDAIVALWPISDGQTLVEATRLAAQCGLALQGDFATDMAGEHLTLKVQIGAGDIQVLYVGGVHGRWESMLIGDALLQTNLLVPQTQPGQVVMSPESWALVEQYVSGTPLRAEAVLLESIREPQPSPEPAPARHDPGVETLLRSYVPRAMVARIAAGQNEWLAELRRVTVLFINLPELSYATSLQQAHAIVSALQTVIYRYEGSIDKLSVDDKGVSLLAAFGLPPLAHEDDAVRAVHAALDIQKTLRQLKLSSAIGIASGAVFCGEIGNTRRREYTMIGDVVNVAARLMEHAYNDVLCDERTVAAAQERLHFTPLPPLNLKGKDELVPVFRPDGAAQPSARPSRTIVGRQAELTVLEAAMSAARDGRGGVYIIEGEAGIGKSTLLETIMRQGRLAGLRVLEGAGQAIEQGTPYRAWRAIVSDLLYLHALPKDEPLRSRVLAVRLDLPGELLPYAPLLNLVAPLDLPETPESSRLNDLERADWLRRLLLHLLSEAAHFPTLLVLEDAHWLDSASWSLLETLHAELPSLLMVIGARPPLARAPHPYLGLRSQPDVRLLALDNLSSAEIESIVADRLGVDSLPPLVTAMINEKAEGHPFWSEEIAYALRDADLIRIEDGACVIAPNITNFDDMVFPDTIQGVITSRIDRLSPQQQLTLKVASVIGRVFAFRALHEIYPIGADKPHLIEHLEGLHQLDITPLEEPEPNLRYIFKHAITQDVAYNLMLYAQRRQLHRAVAEWYERVHAADLAPYATVLAHHWSYALDGNDPDPIVRYKAVSYCEQAGAAALSICAYREAAGMFERALSLLAGQPADHHKMTLHLSVGEVYWRLGEPTLAMEHLTTSLELARIYGAPQHEADILRKMGNVAYVQGDLATAQGFFESSLELARRINDTVAVARAVSNVGVVAWARGDHATAQRAYQESFAICLENNDQFGIAVNLINLGQVGIALGQYGPAQAVLHDALQQAQEHGWPLVTINVIITVVDLWLHTGNLSAGAELIGLVEAHEASDSEARTQVAGLRARYADQLAPDDLAAALDRGGRQSLGAVVERLLDLLDSSAS